MKNIVLVARQLVSAFEDPHVIGNVIVGLAHFLQPELVGSLYLLLALWCFLSTTSARRGL